MRTLCRAIRAIRADQSAACRQNVVSDTDARGDQISDQSSHESTDVFSLQKHGTLRELRNIQIAFETHIKIKLI